VHEVIGLTSEEAQRRLVSDGRNEWPDRETRTLRMIIFRSVREPMFLLLFLAASVYLVIGDLGEGLFLTAGACLAVALVIVQEARSERALRALRTLATPTVRVFRDGLETKIPSVELVTGDVILVGEGERLPADARLRRGDTLGVDESVLTGESAPVDRFPEIGTEETEQGLGGVPERHRLLGGTLVVRGHGLAEVVATGSRSALGRLSSSLSGITFELTPLQRRSAGLIAVLGGVAILFCGVVALTYGWLRDDWIGGILAGVTVAVALVPEEFPMVLAVFMALGAWRLARRRVLVRRSAVIETLGGAGVLCVDKTGTLTENRMEVESLWTPERGRERLKPEGASGDCELLRIAALASRMGTTDPIDQAVMSVAPSGVEQASPLSPTRTWPLTSSRLAVIQLWDEPTERTAAAKGAPEAIFDLCALKGQQRAMATTALENLAASGLRVLGVAAWRGGDFPEADPGLARFEFRGLIGFLDPLRSGALEAIDEARRAGINVVMITGDYAPTAMEIARQAGIDTSGGYLTGQDISSMADDALADRIRTVHIFARVLPEQKLRLVRAFRSDGEIVAMTGDGVNDAPALEAADIGIAMGRRGSDVAREAADIILLDDGLPSIVGGIRLGRRIFMNLRKALMFITAVHFPIAGLAFLPIVLGMPPLMYPMHVVLLELVIDPVCSLVFESEPSEADAMQRPPRNPRESIFGMSQLALSLLQGGVLLVFVLLSYAVWLGMSSDAEARGVGFASLIAATLALAFADSFGRSQSLFHAGRMVFWIIACGVAVLTVAIFLHPALASVFRVDWPSGPGAWVTLALALPAGGWFAIWRRLDLLDWRRFTRQTKKSLG
jgi:Ca2+-transporting ATPase